MRRHAAPTVSGPLSLSQSEAKAIDARTTQVLRQVTDVRNRINALIASNARQPDSDET